MEPRRGHTTENLPLTDRCVYYWHAHFYTQQLPWRQWGTVMMAACTTSIKKYIIYIYICIERASLVQRYGMLIILQELY